MQQTWLADCPQGFRAGTKTYFKFFILSLVGALFLTQMYPPDQTGVRQTLKLN